MLSVSGIVLAESGFGLLLNVYRKLWAITNFFLKYNQYAKKGEKMESYKILN